MKNYRNPARKGEIKCRECDHSTTSKPYGLKTQTRCHITGNWRSYAVAATGTCDCAEFAPAPPGNGAIILDDNSAGGGE